MPFGLATDQQGRNVRLDTLVRLRWLAVIGQSTAVLVVQYALEFEFPFWGCLAVIALSAAVNIALRLYFQSTQWLPPDWTAGLLAFDIAELGLLLFLTGGLQNPFAFLFLGPVLISATALPPRYTVMLGSFAALCATALVFFHYPMPWDTEDKLILPPIYLMGEWLSIILAIGFIGLYAWQIAEESRQLSDALAATELVLAREQHLSQLDGLAAAAAHELATPLSTISVIARELERAIAADSPHGEDIRLLREQATRCRDIIGKLTELPSSQPFDRVTLTTLVEEVVAPHRDFGITINVVSPPDRAAEPETERNPAILYGLGNIVDNAVDFAKSRVEIDAIWDGTSAGIDVGDDGPGFAPEILQHIGEPYVTSRRRKPGHGDDEEGRGLGLGLFIAKTLLERSGATLTFENRPKGGAFIRVRWPRADFERIRHGAIAPGG